MTSIVERLRLYAQQFEDQHAPDHITLALRAGADEIERLRAGGCARDQGTTQYCAEAAKKDADISSLLNTLADARTESMRLRARVTELEGQHKGLVLNNAILRERPDLPLNRIPAARAMTKLYEDNERLRAALREIAGLGVVCASDIAVVALRDARAALEGK